MSTQNSLLKLIQLPMPKQQNEFEQLNLPPLQMPTNNTETIADAQSQNLNRGLGQQPVVDVSPQANAGVQGHGVNWRGLMSGVGSYLNAFGDGLSQGNGYADGIAKGMNAVGANRQNINTYKAYKPYYDQMGVDTSYLDPLKGGSGYGNVSPNDIIRMQDMLETRKMNREYQKQRIDYLQSQEQNRANTTASRTIKFGDLMKISPEFKRSMSSQYDFSNGQNQELLDTLLPSNLVQSWMPTKQVNINYSGGTTKNSHSTSDVNHHSDSKDSGGGSSYKEGQTATNPKTGEKMIFKGGKWQKM